MRRFTPPCSGSPWCCWPLCPLPSWPGCFSPAAWSADQALRAGAARIGSGDLSQQIAIETGDELEALADHVQRHGGKAQGILCRSGTERSRSAPTSSKRVVVSLHSPWRSCERWVK